MDPNDDSDQPRQMMLADEELAQRIAAEELQASMLFNDDRALALRLQYDLTAGRDTTVHEAPILVERPPRAYRPILRFASTLKRAVSHVLGRFQRNCVICQDPIQGPKIRVPCGHFYDKGCLVDLFRTSIDTASLFPPQCCSRPVPLRFARRHIDAVLTDAYNSKVVESKTVNRVYCAQPTCSRFLGAYDAKPSVYKCTAPGCSTTTCRYCKVRVDDVGPHQCFMDHPDKEVVTLGQQSGWTQCPGCEQMVELSTGCVHMTCLCKTQFCYSCGAKWKACKCMKQGLDRVPTDPPPYAPVRPRAVRVAPNPRPNTLDTFPPVTPSHTCPVLQKRPPTPPQAWPAARPFSGAEPRTNPWANVAGAGNANATPAASVLIDIAQRRSTLDDCPDRVKQKERAQGHPEICQRCFGHDADSQSVAFLGLRWDARQCRRTFVQAIPHLDVNPLIGDVLRELLRPSNALVQELEQWPAGLRVWVASSRVPLDITEDGYDHYSTRWQRKGTLGRVMENDADWARIEPARDSVARDTLLRSGSVGPALRDQKTRVYVIYLYVEDNELSMLPSREDEIECSCAIHTTIPHLPRHM